MRRILLFLFTLLLLLPACKKKTTTDSPSNIPPKVQKEAALPTEQTPTHPGTFSPAAEPLGTDKIAHFGVKITFTLPTDADFFEVAICDKAHPTVCSPTQDQPGIFSGSAPVIIPNPLGVTRSATADLDVKIRVCKVQSPSAQPDSLRKALLCADWQSYAAYQVQPTSDPATAALYEDAYQKQQALLSATYNWQLSLADVSSALPSSPPPRDTTTAPASTTETIPAGTTEITQDMQQSVSGAASTSSSVLAAGLSDPNLASDIAGANIAAQKDTIQAALAKNCTDSKGVSSTDPATAEEKCQCPDGTLGDSFTTCRPMATYATACSDVQGTWDSKQNLCMFTAQEMNEKACSDLSATWMKSTTSCSASIPGKQGSAPGGGSSSGYSKGNIAAITVGSLLAAYGAYYMYQMAKAFRGVSSYEKFGQISNSIQLENGVFNPASSETLHSSNITLSYNSKTKYTLEYKLSYRSTEATFTHEGEFKNSEFVTENIKVNGHSLYMDENAEYVREIDAKFNTALKVERAIFNEVAPAVRVKSIIGLGVGVLVVLAGVLTAVCGSGAVSCLADTNELPTKITTSNQRMQAMLQASDDFRASMGTLAQKLYPTAATP